MSNIDYINDRAIFTSLWRRARECMERVAVTPPSKLLHFDSSNIGTEVFLDLIRSIAAFKGAGEFAVIVINPDPFSYFNVHFGKYPGFIVEARHTDDDFFEILTMDPGDSPADAIGFYSEQYAVLPYIGRMVLLCRSRMGWWNRCFQWTSGCHEICSAVFRVLRESDLGSLNCHHCCDVLLSL